MTNLKSIALVFVIALSTLTITAQTRKVDITKSTVNWIGKKATGQHSGIINIKDGALVFNDKKLIGGTFTVAMNTITVTDLQADNGKEDLEGHLKSEDFFDTSNFSTSSLVFKTITDKKKNVYTVTADLTIKGKTNPITFDIVIKGNTATTNLKVDRTKYDIKYRSKNFFEGLGNKLIYDDFELNVNLKF